MKDLESLKYNSRDVDTEVTGNKIKYMIERKCEVERIIRVGKAAEKELEKLNKDIRLNMVKYLFITGE